AFDVVRRQRLVRNKTTLLQHQRHDTGRDRGRHTGSAQPKVSLDAGGIGDALIWKSVVQRAADCSHRYDALAGRDNVRLQDAVIPARSTRAVDGDLIVASADGAVGIEGSDSDGRRRVPG